MGLLEKTDREIKDLMFTKQVIKNHLESCCKEISEVNKTGKGDKKQLLNAANALRTDIRNVQERISAKYGLKKKLERNFRMKRMGV